MRSWGSVFGWLLGCDGSVSVVGMWQAEAAGVMALPSGRLVRGRGLCRTFVESADVPAFGIYLLAARPDLMSWDCRWVRWPDFGLPSERPDARAALCEAWRRAEHERVEVACAGGMGRTGTSLACLAVLDGVPASEAVAYVRENYHPRAVETPAQDRFVTQFNME